MYFGLFDTAKIWGLDKLNLGNRILESLSKLLVALPVCLGAGLICYPLHTVTRRLMLQASESERVYKGFFDCVDRMAREEGFWGFYAGVGAATFQMSGGAIILWVYDEIKTLGGRS